MAYKTHLLKDPVENYTGGYTSEHYNTRENPSSQHFFGIVQVEVTDGIVNLEARCDETAPWVLMKTYDQATIEYMALPNNVRAVATSSARVWINHLS